MGEASPLHQLKVVVRETSAEDRLMLVKGSKEIKLGPGPRRCCCILIYICIYFCRLIAVGCVRLRSVEFRGVRFRFYWFGIARFKELLLLTPGLSPIGGAILAFRLPFLPSG